MSVWYTRTYTLTHTHTHVKNWLIFLDLWEQLPVVAIADQCDQTGSQLGPTERPAGQSASWRSVWHFVCPTSLHSFYGGLQTVAWSVDWVGERRVGREIAPYELKLSQKKQTQHLHYLQQRQVLINQTHPQSGSLFSATLLSDAYLSVSLLAQPWSQSPP